MEGIHCESLNSIKTSIMVGTNIRDDFVRAVYFYKDVITQAAASPNPLTLLIAGLQQYNEWKEEG